MGLFSRVRDFGVRAQPRFTDNPKQAAKAFQEFSRAFPEGSSPDAKALHTQLAILGQKLTFEGGFDAVAAERVTDGRSYSANAGKDALGAFYAALEGVEQPHKAGGALSPLQNAAAHATDVLIADAALNQYARAPRGPSGEARALDMLLHELQNGHVHWKNRRPFDGPNRPASAAVAAQTARAVKDATTKYQSSAKTKADLAQLKSDLRRAQRDVDFDIASKAFAKKYPKGRTPTVEQLTRFRADAEALLDSALLSAHLSWGPRDAPVSEAFAQKVIAAAHAGTDASGLAQRLEPLRYELIAKDRAGAR